MVTGVGSFETCQSYEGGSTPVTKRVSPIDRVRAEIDQLFAATERPLTEILEDLGRLSVRLLFQTAVEAEVESFLCRARHERRDEDGPAGYRNGYQPPSTVKTTMGPVELQRPKLRDTDELFCSRLFGAASPPTASRSSSAWPRRDRSPPTRGPTSSASSPIGGYARRCWASVTAPRA
jgi:hypothetical protein